MQSEEIQIKTTKLSIYLLKSKELEDEWFKEHHSKIVDNCTKKSITSSFLGLFYHPEHKAEYLYVSFMTKENVKGPGLLYPTRAFCYLDKKEMVKKGSKKLKEFFKELSIQNCTTAIINEILHHVAETFPGVPVAEMELS